MFFYKEVINKFRDKLVFKAVGFGIDGMEVQFSVSPTRCE